MILKIVGILLLMASSFADKKVLNCFNRTAGRAIANTNPLAELWNLTPYECMRFCLSTAGYEGQRCYAIVYHLHYHTCQLYDHSGSKPPAFKVPAFGHDFYIRISEVGDCASPEVPRQFELPPGTAGTLPGSSNYAGKNKTDEVEQISSAGKSTEQQKHSNNDDDDYSDYTDNDDDVEQRTDADTIEDTGAESTQKSTSSENVDGSLESILPPTTDQNCEFGQKIGFFVAPAYELAYPADTVSIVINGTDDDFCAVLCKDNTTPDGTSIACAAYSFFPFDKKCVIHTAKAYPNGRGRLAYNKDSIYSEKFCQPVAAPENCPAEELFLEFPKLELIGFDVNMEPQITKDLVGCMQLCIVNSEHCRSVVYEAQFNVCRLKTTDFNNNPEAFQEAESSIFFVENGCVTNVPPESFDNLPPIGAKQKSLDDSNEDQQLIEETTTHFPDAPPELSTTPSYEDYNDDDYAAKISDRKIDQYVEFSDDFEEPWSHWTPCQFEVVGHIVRVRTRGCDIFECDPGALEVEKCEEKKKS